MLLRSAIKLLETVPFFVKSCSYVALDFRTSTSGKTAKGPYCTEQTIYMTMLKDFVAGKFQSLSFYISSNK
jgi:hypothetical protein